MLARWAEPPNGGLSPPPPLLVRKGVKLEDKSDSIRTSLAGRNL